MRFLGKDRSCSFVPDAGGDGGPRCGQPSKRVHAYHLRRLARKSELGSAVADYVEGTDQIVQADVALD
jgi:hypothetical protein